jgi:small redox-active disulfide protein 2
MSKKIKILGTGCPKCKETTAIVKEVVEENNIDVSIEKIEDIMEIMKYNVLSTPAIVIDEQIKFNGRVPSKAEVNDLLKSTNVDPKNNTGSCCCSSKQ